MELLVGGCEAVVTAEKMVANGSAVCEHTDGNGVSATIPSGKCCHDSEVGIVSMTKQSEDVVRNFPILKAKPPDEHFSPELVYLHFSKPKGFALVVNNSKFHVLKARKGTDIDARSMEDLLLGLGYVVSVKHNLTGSEMLDELLSFSEKDHSQCSSAVVVILSHGGDEGKILGVDSAEIGIEVLMGKLNAHNCPLLRGKPKLFFLQCCRGCNKDNGTFVSGDGDGVDEISLSGGEVGICGCPNIEAQRRSYAEAFADSAELTRKIPSEHSDFLISFSTAPGFVSWLNEKNGSWFIQTVCRVFAEDAHSEQILDMLTRVNRMVGEEFQAHKEGYKQSPVQHNYLTRKFFFYPGVHGEFVGKSFRSHDAPFTGDKEKSRISKVCPPCSLT